MKIVIYMLKRFFSIFFGALMFFVLILSLTDLFMNLWNYISRSVSMKIVAQIMLYYIPKATWYSIPIAMLFATAYMLSDFYARNELLAIFASGISLFKFTVPLLIVSIVMSFAMFTFENLLVVQTYAKKKEIQSTALEEEKSLNNDKIVIMAQKGNIIYKSDYFDNKLSRLYTNFILFRNEDKTLDSIIFCDSATWKDDKWNMSNPVQYKWNGTELKVVPLDKELAAKLTEPPETFRNNTISVEEVTTKQAREYIDHLERAGLPSAEAKAEYYKKYAFPFVVFIVVFLAIGLSGKTRKNVLLISLGLSVSAVVLYYVLQMVTMLMAKFGAIPPIMGSWFPVVLFTFISCVLLKYAKT